MKTLIGSCEKDKGSWSSVIIHLTSSVTRLGEISPLLQHFQSLWLIFKPSIHHFLTDFGKFVILLGKFALLLKAKY